MRRQSKRIGFLVVGTLAGLAAFCGVSAAAEPAAQPAAQPAAGPSGFVGWLTNPVPESLPFTLSGGFDIGGQKLEGNRNSSPNFRTYRVIEEGFVANSINLGIESKDKRWYTEFQGLDLSKNDQNYQVRGGQWGLFRFGVEYDETPHIYGTGKTGYERSEGGVYNYPKSFTQGVQCVTGFNADSSSTVFSPAAP